MEAGRRQRVAVDSAGKGLGVCIPRYEKLLISI